MVCFDVKGMPPEQVVKRLLDQRVVASTTPYRASYARVSCGVMNTSQEIDTVLGEIRNLA
jgi:selenocysteine lyase/cysteine desulfurase